MKWQRVAIAGAPRAGKTTLGTKMAAELGVECRETDSTIDLGWGRDSEKVKEWMEEEGPLVIEGMAVPRALRKWFVAHPDGRPVDAVIWMGWPRVNLTDGQRAMGIGAATVMKDILPELRRRGVEFVDWEAPKE